MLRKLVPGTILLAGVAAAATPNPAAEPPAEQVQVRFAPIADHHLHLLSPAGAALSTPPYLPEITLPADLSALVRERWRRWHDQPSLAELYTPDALYYTGRTAAWAHGAQAAAGYVRWTISDTPYRLKPVRYNVQGNSANVASYVVEDDGTDRIFGTSLLSLVRDETGQWRIAAENYIYRGSLEFEAGRTAAQLIADMDAAGIQRGVVLSDAYYFDSVRPEPVPNAAAMVRAENDWTAAQVAQFPGRLVAFCSFNPLKDYALAELERCASGGRFRGIKLHFNAAQLNFADPAQVAKVRAVMAAANRHHLPMIIHVRPGNDYGRAEAEAFLHRLVTAAPDVPIQIAHLWGGETYSPEALAVYADAVARHDPATRNLYFDISGVTHYARKEDMAQIAARIRQIGLGRILFGSDAPILATISAMRTKLPLTDAEFRVIASNTAPYLR